MFLLYFLIIEWYFLFPAVIAQNYNSTAKLAILIEILTKEAKSEMETHQETAEAKISKCPM